MGKESSKISVHKIYYLNMHSFGYAYFISNKLFLAFKSVEKLCFSKEATIVFLWAMSPEKGIYKLLYLLNQ